MQVFTLLVYFAGEGGARHVKIVSDPKDVLSRIPLLLDGHSECEHIVVMLGKTKLFAVDCKGNRLPD